MGYVIDPYSHHVITLHVWLILILTLVVELPEKVEGHHRVEIDHNCQQANCQHQLQRCTDVTQQSLITNICLFTLVVVETQQTQQAFIFYRNHLLYH